MTSHPTVCRSLSLAVALLIGASAAAQAPSLLNAPNLSDEQLQAIEKEAMADLPELAPIGDPKRVEQLWTVVRRLIAKRAYCRAVSYIEDIETNLGAQITENQSASAQAFFMCARTRLGQDDIAGSEKMLGRAKTLVRGRPEYRDLEFKLALIHAKEQMDTGDIEAMRHFLTEARQLGVDMGPGRRDKLADWAIPLMYDAVSEISAWSYEQLKQEKLELADKASKLCIEFNPRDKIARQVQREVGMANAMVPAIIVILALILAVILWQVFRRFRVRSAAKAGIFDDDFDDLEDLPDDPEDDLTS